MPTRCLLRENVASVIRRDLLCVIGVASAVLLALPAGARAQAESQTLVIAGTSTAPQVRPSTTARTLHELIQEALVNNLRVRIDLASIGEARALYELAAAQAYPRFNATALFGGPTPERKTLVQNDISTVTPASLKNAKFNFGELGFTIRLEADAVLPLYTFGKISSGKDAASSVIRAAGEKKVITQAEVMMDTFRAFWAYQLTRSFVGSLRDGEKTLQKVLKKIEEMLDADSGQVTENDRLRLLHAVATVRVKLNEAETARQIAKAALKLLIGRGQDGALDVVSADLDELPAEGSVLERGHRGIEDRPARDPRAPGLDRREQQVRRPPEKSALAGHLPRRGRAARVHQQRHAADEPVHLR